MIIFIIKREYLTLDVFLLEKGFTNVMEEIVTTLVKVAMLSPDYQTFCRCKKCRNDIISLSLNGLPNHYVTTKEGRDMVFESLNTHDNRMWINKRIISAIHLVGKYPKHGERNCLLNEL
ncbi:late competence development ComFB family protein [Rossellomorea sp. BNER]|nr:late competence development ComFB family protein [Rossellomorea sp. BNER]